MNSKKPSWRTGLRAAALLTGAMAMLVGGMLRSDYSLAAAPAANQAIGTQATATYLDSSGTTRTVQSNSVTTTVQQVGSYSFVSSTGGAAQFAGAGNTIGITYTLTNTGNGSDKFRVTVAQPATGNTFSAISVSPDADGDHKADAGSTPLIASVGATNGASATSADFTIAAGGQYQFVVLYTLPATAGAGWSAAPIVTGAPSATPATTYSVPSVPITESIQSTQAAAFTVSSGFSVPGVAAASGSWPAGVNSGKQGSQTTYTITYSNTGAAAGNLYLKTDLSGTAQGFSYQAGSAVWSTAPGTAAVTNVNGNSNFQFLASGTNKIEAVIANVPVGQVGTISFVLNVSGTAALGTSQTQATTSYTAQTCASGGNPPDVNLAAGACASGAGITTTGATTFTVLPTYGVFVGTQDTTAGTPGAGETVVAPTDGLDRIVAGGSTKFTFAVKNSGNAQDTFKLTTLTPTSGTAFPAGTTFLWLKADGVTPLTSSTSDTSAVDTGPVDANTTVNVILQVTIPSTTAASATANYQVWALATSANDTTVKDAQAAKVTKVLSGLVDLTREGPTSTTLDAGPGSATPLSSYSLRAGASSTSTVAALNSQAGQLVVHFTVANYDSVGLAFQMASSQTSTIPGNLPTGWTVKYYSDPGLATPLTGTANDTTASVTAINGTKDVYAVIQVGATASAVTNQDIYIRAQSTSNASTNGVISDYVHFQVTVSAASTSSFMISGQATGQVAANVPFDIPHVLTNTGTTTCGSVATPMNYTLSIDKSGWSVLLYDDKGTVVGSVDAGDTILAAPGTLTLDAPGTVSGNSPRPLIIRVIPASTASVNDVGTVTFTITDPNTTNSCGTQTITDKVTVVNGQLTVVKYQALNAGCATASPADPTSSANISATLGDCVTYKVVATNTGASPVNNVSLTDSVPAYTTYASSNQQPASQCVTTGTTDSFVYNWDNSTTVTCKTVAATNSLNPNGTLTLRYAVKINSN